MTSWRRSSVSVCTCMCYHYIYSQMLSYVALSLADRTHPSSWIISAARERRRACSTARHCLSVLITAIISRTLVSYVNVSHHLCIHCMYRSLHVETHVHCFALGKTSQVMNFSGHKKLTHVARFLACVEKQNFEGMEFSVNKRPKLTPANIPIHHV